MQQPHTDASTETTTHPDEAASLTFADLDDGEHFLVINDLMEVMDTPDDAITIWRKLGHNGRMCHKANAAGNCGEEGLKSGKCTFQTFDDNTPVIRTR